MSRRRTSWDVALLFLGPLLLVATGVALRHRASARFTLPDSRFHLVVNRIEFFRNAYSTKQRHRSEGASGWPPKLARLLKPGEEVLSMYVFVAGEGNTPKWWLDDKKGRPDVELTDVVITDRNHKATHYPSFTSGSGLDIWSSQQRYNILADCYVPQELSLKGGTITATAWIQHAGRVRFSAPIDDSKTTIPSVFSPVTTPGIQNIKFTPSAR